MLFFLTLALAAAFTDWQARHIRESIRKYGAVDAVFVDVVMAQDYAHTDVQNRIVSIDARRFDCCPNSFASVVRHELDHTRGRTHCRSRLLPFVNKTDPTLPLCETVGDPMGYILTTDAQGHIVDDLSILTVNA